MDETNKIIVDEIITTPHPLYLKNQKSFSNAKTDEKDILYPREKIYFYLKVTSGTLKRSLNIMDALVKAFEQRGWKFKCICEPELKMQITLNDEIIEFSIHEKTKQVEHVLTEKEIKAKKAGRYVWPPRWDYESTGQLILNIENSSWLINRHSWRDAKIQRVEHCLNKFCISVIELSEAIKIDRIRKEAEEKERRAIELEREHLQKLRDTELEKRKVFEAQVNRWEKAEKYRAFINTVNQLDNEMLTNNENDVNKKD